MKFEEFVALKTIKQREIEYVRMEFENFENLRAIVKQNEKIIELLKELNKKE